MATGWKRGAEIALSRFGAPFLARRLNRPSTVLLAYHNIVPMGESLAGDAGLHVDQQVFADHLDFLAEHYDVVGLEALREKGARTAPRVVVTFDDAYYGTMTAGLEELRQRSLPATVFVPPGLLGAPGFWWDRLAQEGGGSLPEELRSHCLRVLQGRHDRILGWAIEQGIALRELPEHAKPVDQQMLVLQAGTPGISLASHTWSHANLAALPGADIEDEFARSKSWLETNSPAYVNWLAYPYGLHNDIAVRCAEKHFCGAVLIRGGFAERRGHCVSQPHTTPRFNVSRRLTLDGLALRLAGLFT